MKTLQLYLTLRLKSFHPYYLNRFVSIVTKKLRNFFPVFEQQIFLPKNVERFTVLRSPHVDKKARDQFERRTHQRILCWVIPYSGRGKNFFLLFLRMFRTFASLAIGVEFRITYMLSYTKKFANKKNKKKNLNANN